MKVTPRPKRTATRRDWRCRQPSATMEGESFHQLNCWVEWEVIAIVTVGVDLAEIVFAVHGVDELCSPKPLLHCISEPGDVVTQIQKEIER